MLVRTPAHGYAGTCAAIRDADLRPDAGRIAVPTLCVAGDQDGSTPPDVVKGTADLIPGARFELIDGAGHIPCIEKPAVTVDTHQSSIFRRLDLSEKDESERYKAGMAVRRQVLGDAHVDRASAQMTEFDADFQTFITEGAWGSVWSRPGFTLRERSIVTIALLAALGQDEEVAMHVRATANTGATQGGHQGGAAACGGLCRRAGGQPRLQDRQEDLCGNGSKSRA